MRALFTGLNSKIKIYIPSLLILKMLLAKKASKTIKNNYGQTAYETLLAPFNQVKPVYETLGNALSPLGLKLDYAYIEKTRPVIAKMLK